MKKRLALFVFSLFLAILVYTLFAVFADWEETWKTVKNLGLMVWVPILLLSLANYFLRFLRWSYYLKKMGKFDLPSHGHHWLVYLSGFALTTTPGKAGEGLRAFYLKPYGVNFMQSLSALFTERLVDLMAIVLLSLFIVLQFPEYQLPALLAFVVLIVVTVLVSSGKIVHIITDVSNYCPKLVKNLLKHVNQMLESSALLLSPVMLGKGVGIGLLAWVFEGYGFYYLLQYMGLEVPLLTAIAIYCTAVLVGALSFLPGGLGGTEAVMVFLLVVFGAEESQAVAATLVCRVATLWFAVVLGVISLSVLLRDGLPDWDNTPQEQEV